MTELVTSGLMSTEAHFPGKRMSHKANLSPCEKQLLLSLNTNGKDQESIRTGN